MTTNTERLVSLADRPEGITCSEASSLMNYTQKNISGIFSGLFRRNLVTRVADRKTITGKEVYRYFTPKAAPVEAAKAVPKPSASPAKAVRPRERVQETPVMSFDDLVSQMVDAMAGAVVSQLKAKIAEKMHAMLPAPERVVHAPEVLPAKASLPKALIIGLLPAQAGLIQQEFHDAFDLRFWGVDENYRRLDQIVETAAHIVLMTSKVNHKVSDHLRHRRVKMINGGMSELRSALTELFLEGT